MQTALSRLDGVKSVKHTKEGFVVQVLENKALLADALEKAIVDAGYGYEGATIEAVGKVEKDGDNYVFVARASGQKYSLTANEELKKMVADGKSQLVLKGALSQPEEKEGKKQPPAIEVSSAKEPPKDEPKKEEKK